MRRAALAATVICAVHAGCGGDDGEQAGGGIPKGMPGGHDRPYAPEHTVADVRARNGDKLRRATGVVYDAHHGLLVTSNHAVEAAEAIEVTMADGMRLPARILARAQCHDFAVLKLYRRPPALMAIRFGDSDRLRNGEGVRALSFALTGEGDRGRLTATRGPVAARDITTKLATELPPIGPLVAHQAPLNDAGSGGPLLNARGEMVAVNTLASARGDADRLPGVHYALASNYLREMLRQLKPGRASAFVGWQHEHRCHQGMAELAGVPEAAGSSVRKPGTEYGDDARNGKRGGHGRRAGDGRRAGLSKHGGHG